MQNYKFLSTGVGDFECRSSALGEPSRGCQVSLPYGMTMACCGPGMSIKFP